MSLKVCPKCSSWRVLGSETGSLLDRFLQSLHLRRYFCGDCGWQGISRFKEARPTSSGPSRLLLGWRYLLVFVVFTGTAYGLSVLYGQFEGSRLPKSVESVLVGTSKADSSAMKSIAVTQAQPPAQKAKIIGNSDSKRYHLPGMKYYDQVEAYHRVEFSSEEEAISVGYRKAPR